MHKATGPQVGIIRFYQAPGVSCSKWALRIFQEEGIIIVTGGLVKVAYNEFQGTSQTYYIGVGGMFGIFSALTGELSIIEKTSVRA